MAMVLPLIFNFPHDLGKGPESIVITPLLVNTLSIIPHYLLYQIEIYLKMNL